MGIYDDEAEYVIVESKEVICAAFCAQSIKALAQSPFFKLMSKPQVLKMKRAISSQCSSNSKKLKRIEDLDIYTKPNPAYYPNPLIPRQANEFNNNKRVRPIEKLNGGIDLQPNVSDNTSTFIHWFRADLRVQDNTAFYQAVKQFQACKKANSAAKFIGIFTICEHDWRAHLDSGWKIKFLTNAIDQLKQKLKQLNVPLVVKQYRPEESQKSKLSNSPEFAKWLKTFCLELSGNEPLLLTANAQYETDELYRDIKVLESTDETFQFKVFHDQCVIRPGELTTGKGSQYTVFTPWYKKWCQTLYANQQSKEDIVEIKSIMEDEKLNDDFPDCESENYTFPEEFSSYIPVDDIDAHLPPATEAAAMTRLNEFIETGGLDNYNGDKDQLQLEGTSLLSCYVTSGLISTRSILDVCFKRNNRKLLHDDIKQNNSIETFIKEVAWRDFYKHVMCQWPYISMDVPFRFEMADIKWENNMEYFEKWCYGETGYPIVDAIMSKLLHTGYINNRSRMIVASFLSKNLLINWQWGERWFRKHLIDGDLSSNVGGWGFCSSTGIDAQPYFRIFNMFLQSERYDREGKFIKRWVPALSKVVNVHKPYGVEGPENQGKLINDYPYPIIDRKESRERALEAYREAI